MNDEAEGLNSETVSFKNGVSSPVLEHALVMAVTMIGRRDEAFADKLIRDVAYLEQRVDKVTMLANLVIKLEEIYRPPVDPTMKTRGLAKTWPDDILTAFVSFIDQQRANTVLIKTAIGLWKKQNDWCNETDGQLRRRYENAGRSLKV